MNEEVRFHVERDEIRSLDTNMVNMTAESLNFWLTKFFEGVYKEDGGTECLLASFVYLRLFVMAEIAMKMIKIVV